MALITGFESSIPRKPKLHPTQVSAFWSVSDIDGKRLFQLDTRGSEEREAGQKQSQTIQLDEHAARELIGILKSAFDLA